MRRGRPKVPRPVDEIREPDRERMRRILANAARYEYIRRLNVPQFQSIFKRALGPERFDDIIDACIAGCTPQCREDDFPGCAHCMSPPHPKRDY